MAGCSGVSPGSLKRFENTGNISFDSLLPLRHLLGRLIEFDKLLLTGENLDTLNKLFTQEASPMAGSNQLLVSRLIKGKSFEGGELP